MTHAKVSLSPQELQMVQDTEWLHRKRVIIAKVYQLFANLTEISNTHEGFQNILSVYRVQSVSAKISKGDNYKQLPYVVLDHPRNFEGKDVFSMRTFFWWGHFLSLSLHLQGHYRERFFEQLFESDKALPSDLYLCVHESPWEYSFGKENYLPPGQWTKNDCLKSRETAVFTKWGVKLEIMDFDISEKWFAEALGSICNLLG